jgi:tRNA 2-thiouridine synthesizing protein A
MADKTLDVCNEVCPMPIVKTGEALKKMKSGETLEVIIDYAPSRENVQRFVTNEGHKVLSISEDGGLEKIVIEKK